MNKRDCHEQIYKPLMLADGRDLSTDNISQHYWQRCYVSGMLHCGSISHAAKSVLNKRYFLQHSWTTI